MLGITLAYACRLFFDCFIISAKVNVVNILGD